VIERQKAVRLVLLVVFCMAVGLLWAAAGEDRLRLVQTTAQLQNDVPPTTETQPQAAKPSDRIAVPQGRVEVKAPVVSLFDDYRIERDKARSAQVELLKLALADKGIGEPRREQLTAELFNLLKRSESELQAETLLKAKGYVDAVVVLSQNGANAVVPDVLERDDASRVGELVSRATGVAMERITIIDGASRS
jgi:stage III sporulation protein AH